MPMRSSMRLSAATLVFRSGIACCTATAQRTASTTLANSTKQAVAGGLDDAAMVLGDRRIDELAAQRLEAFERAFLTPISREYPATSAAKIAARRRSTRAGPGGFMAPPRWRSILHEPA